MSSPPLPPPTPPSNGTHPAHLELVAKILQKTKEKKLQWQKDDTGSLSTLIGDRIQIRFVRQQKPGSTLPWNVFSVKTPEGAALIVRNVEDSFAALSLGAGQPDPLLALVSELYAFITQGMEKQRLEKAIDTLDSL